MGKRKALVLLSLAGLLTFASPAVTANAAWKTTSSGRMYTQSDSPGYVTGRKEIEEKWYYFNEKGILQTGWITAPDGKRYYADKNGVLAVSKWVGKYYFQEDGSMAANAWIEGKYVGADGKFTGKTRKYGWVTASGKTYYYDSDGKKATGWLTVEGKTYYLHASTGVLQKGWLKIGGKMYFAGPKQGVILKSQWLSGKYLTSTGAMATGWTTVGSKTYYFDSAGKKQTGWIKYDGHTYYFNSSGVMQKSTWVGKKYLTSTGAMAIGFTTIKSKVYYFSSSGTRKTGWLSLKGKRYYLDKNGVLQRKCWLPSKNYYATSSGAVVMGLGAVGGQIYYFDTTTGKKLTSSLKTLGSDTYYFQKDGTAAKSKWVKIDSKYYYFQSTGKLAKNTWVGKYYVDKDGVRTDQVKTTGWSTIDGKKCYFDKNGKMVTGLAVIGGQKYYFTSDGAMVSGITEIKSRKYYFYPDGRMATSITLAVGTKQYTMNKNGVIVSEESIKISADSQGAKIVNYALQFVGNRYVYGGTSLTNGADCSGFVQTIFSKFGYKLLRVADDQMKGPSATLIKQGYTKGVEVSLDSLQPGDLLFYGSGNYASHVAIYMGDGKIVHASNSQPYPAGGIKISNYDYQTPLKAVRYWS